MSTQVVPLGAVHDALPTTTPTVTVEDRAAELSARQDHLRWRFRT